MVGRILCFSVVARMNTACLGGSSKVFRKALKASLDNMWTSSMTYTLYCPSWGGIRTWSMMLRMCSTPLLEAASNSKTLKLRSACSVVNPLMALAKMRAQVVLPTPRGPQKRYAWAICPDSMLWRSVSVMDFWPTTVSHVVGRYFRAETRKLLPSAMPQRCGLPRKSRGSNFAQGAHILSP